MNSIEVIRPFCMPIQNRDLPKNVVQRKSFLSQQARCMAQRSYDLLVAHSKEEMQFPKNESGAPQSWNGYHWSVSHKPSWVGGVVSTERVSLDIEEHSVRDSAILKKIATEKEISMFRERNLEEDLALIWSLKESMAKYFQVGVFRMKECTLLEIPNTTENSWGIGKHKTQQIHLTTKNLNGAVAALCIAKVREVNWNTLLAQEGSI